LVEKDYNIGLDIGTSSIGFAAVDDSGKPIRAKGKTVIGVRLFDEGQTAEERRMFRTTRRRLSRRRWRIGLLNQMFAPYLAEVDDTFLARLKESNLAKKDPNRKLTGSLLFPEKTDAAFYDKYPTMYHLRKALMEEQHQFDIREIYLAMHHIIKYRGNFLDGSTMQSFNITKIDFTDQFDRLNELYQAIGEEDAPFKFEMDNLHDIESLLLDKDLTKLDRRNQAAKLMPEVTKEKELKKFRTKLATNFSKAILGYKAQLDVILNLQVDEPKDWSIQLGDEELDDQLATLTDGLEGDYLEIIEILRGLASRISLNTIVENGQSLSASMVEKYEAHKKHLGMLKEIIHSETIDRKKAKALKAAYNKYMGKMEEDKSDKNKPGSKFDKFKNEIKRNLDDSENAKTILELIERDQFMPKQRTSENGVIPHQLHQKEMDAIIENQGEYYPFLKEANPNPKRVPHAKYKLDELIAFKIPYYVGPLVTPEVQENESGASFAWMVRKSEGEITPWNFEEKVDRMESANQFIRRMTTKDTYLFSEDVLPAESLIYQRYNVLNELNNVRANGRRLSNRVKQDIFNKFFKEQKNVTAKQIANYLDANEKYATKPTISGLSDPDHFVSSLSTYHDFKKIFGDEVDNVNRQEDFEKIIEWSTIFEDRGIFEEKLNELNWLTEKQVKLLRNKRYRGWGRLSKKLLTGIKNEQGASILDELWNSGDNFMQIQSRGEFAEKIAEKNARNFEGDNLDDVWQNIEKVLSDAYTSPQNKKAIRQVVKVVQDIEKAVGKAPKKIAIEFTRGADKNPRRTQSRQFELNRIYQNISQEIIDAELINELKEITGNKKRISDKLYLYFTQMGRDIYTNKPINIDELYQYDIDHILPQSFIKDDSLDNRVLTSRAINNGKSDNVPSRLFDKKIKDFWRDLQEAGLITKFKYKNLTTDPETIDKYTKQGFIKRQLVETSQVVKLSANILGSLYQEDTEILEVRAKLTHQMREMFDLVKIRDLNDYHHGFDAYLTVFVANFLYKRYPKLRPYFVYSEFKKLNDEQFKNMKQFNYLKELGNDKVKKVCDKETGEILWSNVEPKSIVELKKIYNYKFMLTSQEVSTRQRDLFDQTIHPQGYKGNLIPIKQNKPTELYGGYSGSKDTYMVIIAIKDKKGKKYKVVGVPTRAIKMLDLVKEKHPEQYAEKLHEVLATQIAKEERNKKTAKNFEIVLDKLRYRQLVQDGSRKFTIGSSTYVYNAKQLVISEKSSKIICDNKKYDSRNEDDDLINVYDEILEKVNESFDLFDINKFRQKLNDNRDKFVELPIQSIYKKDKLIQTGKREIIKQMLIGLHTNAARGELKPIGFSTKLGMLQIPSGIPLSPDAVLIYQSPTGLFERRIKVSDL
jgi:CRISPR-associated endonuclease Csn1